MISVDTEVLKYLADAARTANEELESASQLLNQITMHDDWGCWERETIHSYIQSNRRKLNVLMESSRNFTEAVRQAAEQFVRAENEVSGLFDGVETLLSRILSVPAENVTTTPVIVGVAGGSSGIGGSVTRYDNGELLAIADFNSVLSGLEGMGE